MLDLVTINDNHQPVTTSAKIAEVFGKEHRNVIRAINNIIGDLRNLEDSERHNFVPTSACDSNRLNFELVNDVNFHLDSYIDVKGEKRKQYIVTRDGFTLLAMGFTGKKALEFKIQYIAAFNAMEEKLKNSSQLPAPVDMKAIGGAVKRCAAAAIREEAEKAFSDMVYTEKFKTLVREAIREELEIDPSQWARQDWYITAHHAIDEIYRQYTGLKNGVKQLAEIDYAHRK